VKTLLIAKSAVEVLAGLALALFPSISISFLLGSPLDLPAGTVLGRIAGIALLVLGIACWLAHNDSQSSAAIGLIVALLFYDAVVVVILLSARFAMGLSGMVLWPAVVLHSGLGIWSLLCLRKGPRWRQLG
jgi:riboflavin transporter FmnP